MHIKAKKMAFGGMLLALTEIFLALGSILETSTLFLLAAASYFVGVVFREFGGKTGAAFYLAGVLLGIFLSPNKFYAVTYAAMGFYILVSEIIWLLLGNWKQKVCPVPDHFGAGSSETDHFRVSMDFIRKKQRVFLLMKYVVFNLIFCPSIFFFQEVLFGKKMSGWILAGILLAGQIGLFFYDCAYEYAQRELWGKFRGRLTG